MIAEVCSAAEHEATKADLAAYRALAFVGAQTVERGSGETVSLEHRNCSCGSTLTRQCTADEAIALNAANMPPATREAFAILRAVGAL